MVLDRLVLEQEGGSETDVLRRGAILRELVVLLRFRFLGGEESMVQ